MMRPSTSWFGAVGAAVIVGLIAAMSPWINGGSGSAAPVRVAEPRGAMPGVDSVLDRPLDVPLVVTVMNTNDAGAGSLRQAIISAAAGDTIVFAAAVTGTIVLTTGLLDINKNLTIQGPGANVLAVSGNNASKVFVIDAGITASISGLTVRNGTTLLGSGIANSGNLTLTDVAVINNGVVGTSGGGIYNNGSAQLTMLQVLVANNISTNGGGGLHMNHGASMTNVTFFGNQGAFGAIFDAGFAGPPSTASMLNVTITQNTSTSPTGAGGITWGNTDQLTVRNTIVANNQPRNCVGTITSQGNNLEDTNLCGFNQPGDLPNTPAGLDPTGLQNNGGQTQTVLILPSSAAFEGVTQGACPPPSIDQRGVTRPVNVRCDIGAVELQVTFIPTPTRTLTPTPTVTPTATPTCILADMNCDGIVDVRDYGIWRQQFGATNCGNVADLDGNCLVDIRDYGIWRQNFGHTAGAARASGALQAGIAPAPQGTPGPALPTGDQPAARAWRLLGAEGPSPAVPVLPVVGGLLGLGGLAEWRRRRPSGRE